MTEEEIALSTQVYDDLDNEKLDGFIRSIVQFNLPKVEHLIKDDVVLSRIKKPVFEEKKREKEIVKVNKNGICEEKCIDHEKNHLKLLLL